MGDIFKLGGGLSLMLSQVTRRAYPCLIFSRVSCHSCVVGSGSWADGCAPLVIATSIISSVHCVLMAESQLAIVNSTSIGVAGCASVGPLGITRPRKFLLYLLWFSESPSMSGSWGGGGSALFVFVGVWHWFCCLCGGEYVCWALHSGVLHAVCLVAALCGVKLCGCEDAGLWLLVAWGFRRVVCLPS